MTKIITFVCNHCRSEINNGHGYGICFIGQNSARATAIKDAENHLCAGCAKGYAQALLPLYTPVTSEQK